MNHDSLLLRPANCVGVIVIDDVKDRFNLIGKVFENESFISRTPIEYVFALDRLLFTMKKKMSTLANY
jgi:hypothetical protein